MIRQSLRENVPHIYSGFTEFETLIDAEDSLMQAAEDAVSNFHKDQFVLLATEEGLKHYEDMLKIVANPATETIQFRRDRIMNRLSFMPPFSINALRSKLDSILGAGKYSVYADYEEYTLYVESSASNQSWFNEILITMVQMKPANIIFINKPRVSSGLTLAEEVSYSAVTWNYRAGYWSVGNKPFNSIEDKGAIKLANVSSLQPELLAGVADFTASRVAAVLVSNAAGNSHFITDFITKESQENTCVIEYSVPFGIMDEISSITLTDEDGNVLSEFAVYVPILDEVVLKHIINVKEE